VESENISPIKAVKYIPGTVASKGLGRFGVAKERFHSPITLDFYPVSFAIVFVILHHISITIIGKWFHGVQSDHFVAGSKPILYPGLITLQESQDGCGIPEKIVD
jgi:hypothetical protein